MAPEQKESKTSEKENVGGGGLKIHPHFSIGCSGEQITTFGKEDRDLPQASRIVTLSKA